LLSRLRPEVVDRSDRPLSRRHDDSDSFLFAAVTPEAAGCIGMPELLTSTDPYDHEVD
jgi:hypothetical protein